MSAAQRALESAHASTGVVQCGCGARAPGAPSLVELELAGWTFAIVSPARLSYACVDCTIATELAPLDRELAAAPVDCEGCADFGRCMMHAIDPSYRENRCACGCVIARGKKQCGACSALALFADEAPPLKPKKGPLLCKRCRRVTLSRRSKQRECIACRQQPLPLERAAEQSELFR